METTLEITDTNFETEVLKSDRPVLVDFWAEWCGPCKMLAPMLDEIAREQAGRVKVVKVNVDQSPAIAEQFGIHAVPTLFFFAGGEVRDRIVGMVSKRAILFRLDRLAAGMVTGADERVTGDGSGDNVESGIR